MSSIQLPLSLWNNDVSTFSPLQVANQHNFTMQYHETEDGYYYAIRDWLTGLGACSEKDANNQWNVMKHRIKSEGGGAIDWLKPFRYTTRNNKRYLCDFATDIGLVEVTTRLKATVVRNRILGLNVPPRLLGGSIYIIHVQGFSQYKIGYASNFSSRFNSYKWASPPVLSWICDGVVQVKQKLLFEKQLHAALAPFLVTGEWFSFPDPESVKRLVVWLESVCTLDINDIQFDEAAKLI